MIFVSLNIFGKNCKFFVGNRTFEFFSPAISEAADGRGFGRYCYYGCHCMPDRDHSDHAVFGRPIDNIDRNASKNH